MNYKWLNTKNNDRSIVFFSGWGMNENVVNLDYNGYDFLVFFDYSCENFDKKVIEKLKKYNEIFVISWSMGVIFSSLFDLNNIKKRIAINGTLKIIDNEFGINKDIFENTLRNLNKENLDLFYKNMFIKDDDFCKFLKPNRDIKSQINELKFIKTFYENNEFFAKFDKVLMGKFDKIIPYRNQRRYWKNNNYFILDTGHYIFNLFKTWEEIISYGE